jgi:bifunctional pyridoxal-dependent enzyme with beta-cystathionase and maltose regulon repressor activities
MEDSLGVGVTPDVLTTVSVTIELTIPDTDAVMLAVPVMTPVAKPAEETLTTIGLELIQVT